MENNNKLKFTSLKITLLFIISILCVSNLFAQWNFATDYLKMGVNKTGYITSMKSMFKAAQPEFSPVDKPSPLMCLYNSNKV